MVLGLSSCTAWCLAEQTALSYLLLDCTMIMTIDAVFHIVLPVCVLCVCIRNGDFK